MSFKIVDSIRGKPILCLNGYEYNVKTSNNERTYWRCIKYYSLKCKSSLITEGETIIKDPSEHIHDIDHGKSTAREVFISMKEAVKHNSSVSNAMVSGLATFELDVCVQLSLPQKSSLARRLRNHKNPASEEKAPLDRHFQIPDKYKEFLLYDSGESDPERILAFADKFMLNYMGISDTTLFMDGTFKECPTIFYQLFTIHLEYCGYYPVLIYALLPNKTEKTYTRLFEMLKSFRIGKPKKIMADFEISLINSLKKTFPESDLKGCYFHLCQSFLRKINEVGLKTLYQSNPEFGLGLKLLPALAFLPCEEVESAFEDVVEELTSMLDDFKLDASVAEKVETVVCYFQTTYIRGQKIGVSFKPARFPVEIWNQHEAAINSLARTNNAVEGWHFAIQAYFQGSHPSIWTLLDKLQQDAALHKFNIIQGTNGFPNYKKVNYRKLDARVKKIITAHLPEKPVLTLRCMSKLC